MRPGLWVRRGSPPQMLSMHRHDDVEVNLVLEGQLHYLFGGRPLTIHEGEIAVFWAAQPHGLVDSRAGDMCWVHVPFSMLLGWGLPEAETAPLLAARPVITHAPELAIHVAGLAERWVDEVGAESPGDAREPDDDAQIALLEIQAAVRRILRAGSRSPDVDSLSGAGSTIPGPAPSGRGDGTLRHGESSVAAPHRGHRGFRPPRAVTRDDGLPPHDGGDLGRVHDDVQGR